MIIQIRVVIRVHNATDERISAAIENLAKTIEAEFPELETVIGHSPVIVTIDKLDEMKDTKQEQP